MKLFAFIFFLLCYFQGLAQSKDEKAYGMLLGATIGDAAGAPFEFFYPAQRGQWTTTPEKLTTEGIKGLADSFGLKPHFRKATSYAQWTDYAPAGTITDDTRLKIILINTLQYQEELSASSLAQEILNFSQRQTMQGRLLCEEWLSEFSKAAKWQLDMPESTGAKPSERLWAGIPSIAGQMALVPIAALNPNDFTSTYKLAWQLDFLDHSIARDINAALITGLAAALQPEASWASIEAAMRQTDPYGYGQSAYGERALIYWLDFAHEAVARAEGAPSRLFDILEKELRATVWWECWVPLVVVFSMAEIAEFEPLAALQLCIEFGHDTDSYAQLMGAFMGALHGPDIFPLHIQKTVTQGLEADYNQSLTDWIALLNKSKHEPTP
jgi:ADP-ribosylglycohydrolase